VNVEQLSGADLDLAVARAEGFDAQIQQVYGEPGCVIDVPWQGYRFYAASESVKLAASIAFRQHYTLYPSRVGGVWGWLAEAQHNPNFHGQYSDGSPLVAICRLRVAEARFEGKGKMANGMMDELSAESMRRLRAEARAAGVTPDEIVNRALLALADDIDAERSRRRVPLVIRSDWLDR
jgi:hypothetical protein